MANIPEEVLLALAVKNKGGGGGTSNYEDLENKPQIAGTTLSGNKSLADLGIASAQSVTNITNGESINNFAGVEDALSNKQSKLTAGNYIAIENDGTIKVTQGIGVYDVYSYKIEGRVSGTTYWTNVIKYKNGIQQSSNTYYNMEAITPINIDDRLTLQYVRNGVSWHVTLLVDSNEHQAGEDITWKYNVTQDFTETFNVSQDSSTDLATKGDIEAAISSAYHHAGTKTCAELVAGLLVAANEGNVYNMTDSGTTTADFIEGAGQPIKAGDNVGIAKVSDGVYKFDLLSGFVDTTNFVQKSVTVGLLKNDGTVNDEIEGDVVSLKNGLTTLDNEVNGDSTVYPYADVITIPDAIPANLADCTVKIEPVQDLHGYDKPWVGGAGKQIIPLTLDNLKVINTNGTWSDNVYTLNGGTFTVNTDNDGNVTYIRVNGTFTGNSSILLAANFPLLAGDFRVADNCNKNIGGGNHTLQIYGLSSTIYCAANEDKKVEVSTDTNVNIQLTFGATTIDNVDMTPILYKGTERDSTFAPYTNICPISGHTEAVVTRDGKNVCSRVVDGYIDSVNNALKIDNDSETALFYAKEGVTYTRSFSSSTTSEKRYTLAKVSDDNLVNNKPVTDIQTTGNTWTATWTGYTLWYLFATGSTEVKESAQIEVGSVATPYAPYAGKTYTIALGDTIYGGTVDFDSGVMTVKNAKRVFDGTENWQISTSDPSAWFYVSNSYGVAQTNNIICNEFTAGTGVDKVWINFSQVHLHPNSDIIPSGYTAEGLAELKAWLANNNMEVVYPLATPTAIQLTPQQIQLLKGTNTLTASTGDISVTVNGVSGSIGAVQEQVNGLATDKQDKTDNALETTAKTVVGAINEVNTKMQRWGKVSTSTASKWYHIGYIAKSSLGYQKHRFIIAFNGAHIKLVTLRSTPTDGYDNNDTEIAQIYGTANYFGLIVSADKLRVDLYITPGSLAGAQTYQILTEGGEAPSVIFNDPVLTDLTDADMTKVG